MSGKKLIIMGLLALAALLLCLILFIVAIIGVAFISDGCFYRYNFIENAQNEGGIFGANNPQDLINEIGNAAGLSNSAKITKTINLKANGNYSAMSNQLRGIEENQSYYGKWINSGVKADSGQRVEFKVKGEISLCKAYLPTNNLQSDSNINVKGELIEVPKTSDAKSSPISLIFSAKENQWRNIAVLSRGDHVIITLKKNKKTSSTISSTYDFFAQNTITADCSEGQVDYNPVCGRFTSLSKEQKYVDKCKFVAECNECNERQECITEQIGGYCAGGYETVHDLCSCYENEYGTAPEGYLNNDEYTYPYADNLTDLRANLDRNCKNEQEYVDGEYQNKKYFWYSADNAAALLYRLDDANSAGTTGVSGDYKFAEILKTGANDSNVILDLKYSGTNDQALQYKLYTHEEDALNYGGYVLEVKQTKCRRENGEVFSDDFSNRGEIQYVIASGGEQPTENTGKSLSIDGQGKGSIESNDSGNIWLKINNKPEDYVNSAGQYSVEIITTTPGGNFQNEILTPFVNGFKNMLRDSAARIFRNMTCTGIDDGTCTNFFNYIRGILILYVMGYGMMFLMGMVEITQTDLVVRVIKIGLVAGLINESTFEFFDLYVFNLVTNFADEIIANMSGYSMFNSQENVGNPLVFMSDVLSNILLNPTFTAQIMALLSMGLGGIIYFVIMIIAIGMLLIVLFRSITIYLMSFMALAVLMGIAPLFLTFILFQQTRYLFENWIKYCFQYMLEPVMLLAGIIIITQLITIFLDNILSFSVCWKCVLPIKLPFAYIVDFNSALLGVDIFCINWFAPWGYDPRVASLGINLQYIVILLILVYTLWGWADFASSLTNRITGAYGAPSATKMGTAVNNPIESRALKATGLDKASRNKIQASLGKSIDSHLSAKKAAKSIKGAFGQTKHAAKSKMDGTEVKDYAQAKRLDVKKP